MAATAEDRARASAAANLIEARLKALVASPPSQRTRPPAAVAHVLDNLVGNNDAYRDATLAILAFPAAAEEIIDIRLAPPSRRGVTQRITKVCSNLSIPCMSDAFQTLGKGNTRLDGLERKSWRELLSWASTQATIDEIGAAFEYFAEGLAELARPLPPMPELNTRSLTFPALTGLFDKLLSRPSKGAHQQFIYAALRSAEAEMEGTIRVETKTLNAADASAGTVADIQIWRKGILEEAFEISGNQWSTKIAQAEKVRARTDLARIHIIASADVPPPTDVDIFHVIADNGLDSTVDVSVLDIRHEVRSVTARLSRPARRSALNTLYEYLKHKQPDDVLVIEYVQALHDAKLVENES